MGPGANVPRSAPWPLEHLGRCLDGPRRHAPGWRRAWLSVPTPTAPCAGAGTRWPVRGMSPSSRTELMLLGEPWVLYRSGGQVRAFVDRCPHRRCPLTLGHCEGRLAAVRLPRVAFRRGGPVCRDPGAGGGGDAAPDSPVDAGRRCLHRGPWHGLPRSRRTHRPSRRHPRGGQRHVPGRHASDLRARGSAGLLADNFLDIAHFPFVHAGTFGTEESAEVARFTVDRDDWSFTVAYEHPFAHREDPGGRPACVRWCRPGASPTGSPHRSTCVYASTSSMRAAPTSSASSSSPRPTTCRLFTTLWRDDLDGDAGRMDDGGAFEFAVLREDLRVQEAYHELALPLDPTVEVHTRADRATLELRRVLGDLVAAVEARRR